jgi:DNA-binding transcriptional ArsR family regulator
MTDDSSQTTQPQPEQDLLLDGPALRALSHPVRVQIMQLLRKHGPSTASRLAGQLRLNSGATSYHLRQLGLAGLAAEAGDLGNKRDRWWRAVPRALYFSDAALRDDPEAAMAYLNAVATAYAERLVEFGYQLPALHPVWSGAATLSDYPLRLTPAESRRLVGELDSVLARYRRDDDPAAAPPGAELVTVQLQVMPQPAEPAPGRR